jgi:hypothetical protein
VLAAIGSTPLVQLRSVVPAGAARVLIKLGYYNPTGSYKDRMAHSSIEGAARHHARLRWPPHLQPGDYDEFRTVPESAARAIAWAARSRGGHLRRHVQGLNVTAASYCTVTSVPICVVCPL